jgi:serine/threonine protein phosphatase PrpC
MEDTNIMKPDFVNGCSVFGVFDGHLGSEVAKFVEKNFLGELAKNSNF